MWKRSARFVERRPQRHVGVGHLGLALQSVKRDTDASTSKSEILGFARPVGAG